MRKSILYFIIPFFILGTNVAQACSPISPSGVPKIVSIQPIVVSGFGSMKIPAENVYFKLYTYSTGIKSLCAFPKTVHINIVWAALLLLGFGFILGKKN